MLIVITVVLVVALVGSLIKLILLNETKNSLLDDNARLNRELNDKTDLANLVPELRLAVETERKLVKESKVQIDFYSSKFDDTVKKYNELVDASKLNQAAAVPAPVESVVDLDTMQVADCCPVENCCPVVEKSRKPRKTVKKKTGKSKR